MKNAKDEKAEEKKFKDTSLISDYDIHLFKEGKHFHLYKKFGSHLMTQNGVKGVYFALWAPNAKQVSVIGDFNEWKKMAHPMKSRPDESGIWEVFIPEAKKGSLYKYFLRSTNGYEAEKGDPFAFMWETPPKTASVVWDLDSKWNDGEWMKDRKEKAGKPAPVSVYEMHIGSWKRVPEDGFRSLSYREMAKELPGYLKEMGFTHVEFMPVMEHPFFGSWGYQITGYFAPSSRFGNPQDFMFLIDALHQAGIGIILDWVPSHFPSDLHGLHYFDGTYLYEHEDPQKGFHPDWQSYIFNYGRNEVRSFLISNALFWLEKFHADGLRVDAVASMLYLDYSRKHGEWEPNKHGGNENLEAISFLKEFNEVVYAEFPDVITIAEESTAWPNVSKPTYMGGLGFGMKWMMGWMHDTLEYFKKDPIHRKHHQNTITFSTTYAFSENFMLPLSHDEVVYGKQALLNKMPGDNWNKFANLRALYSYMYAHSGTKLLFMGAEFAQIEEWDHDSSLDWHLTEQNSHKGIQQLISRLNELYKTEPALYEKSFEHDGFEWVDFNDTGNSVISFLRKGNNHLDTILVVANLTPVTRENYRIGVPEAGNWKEIFNSDNEKYGGSGVRNEEVFHSQKLPLHNKNNSVEITLPPMAVLYLKKKAIPL
ncbi:1,4-alpha-glucan branching protein GlgB [Antarcticibacterium arcticum]|uniref:1,4-alpha-glucan branching protein GlgB n=1 Tax=Antarcticibacterium arcticum TaxID=2585771 RepID=UPI001F10272D